MSHTSRRRVTNRVWARAVIALVVYVATPAALFGLGVAALYGGLEPIWLVAMTLAATSLFAGLIIGPAWVFQARTRARAEAGAGGGAVPA